MSLSFTVLICQSVVLLLLGIAIGMEITAWLNDFLWNDMKDNPKNRFNLTQLQKCVTTSMNGTVQIPTQADYDSIFSSKKRDLPFEIYFLGIVCTSFVLYFVSSMIYLSWKRIMPNIYIVHNNSEALLTQIAFEISISVNFLGTIIHSLAFCLILSSTVMYSEEPRKYMGAKACYKFVCQNCPDPEVDGEYYERSRHLFLRTRYCLENLNVCHSSWLKDRVVFILLFCILASMIAFISSLARCRRRSRKNQVQPKQFSFDSDDVEEVRTEVEKPTKPSATTPLSNITSPKSSGTGS